MTKNELSELTIMLYDSSKLMKGIDSTASDVLFSMSVMTLKMYEIAKVPLEIREDIENIKLGLLSDD